MLVSGSQEVTMSHSRPRTETQVRTASGHSAYPTPVAHPAQDSQPVTEVLTRSLVLVFGGRGRGLEPFPCLAQPGVRIRELTAHLLQMPQKVRHVPLLA